MPNTCAPESMSCTHNIIYFLQQDEYREMLKKMIEQSLSSIQQHFYGGCEPVQINTLRARLTQSTHIQNLAVFFLLLNVDADLKSMIMDMEVRNNHAKLTRFMLDLRKERVPLFYTNERQTVVDFVDKCMDNYLIA